ncbi:MAG TPA: hypothetical protein VNA19_05275 [Pyrinomonadaceae bacterium]|jgi:hypothetical protein|nr:hypothetical protein [Pyrinomonadaceae bacterium]
MKRRLLLTVIVVAAVCTIIAPALMPPTGAQQPRLPGSAPAGNPKDRMVEDKIRSDEIERVRRDAARTEQTPQPVKNFPQIKEDFERMQIINSDVLQAGALVAVPDYGRLAEAASEIKKRAARLKSGIFPAGTEKASTAHDKETTQPRDLKALLAALDDALAAFVHNPLFTNLRVVDAEDSANARRDIESVIKLSARIRKEATKLAENTRR